MMAHALIFLGGSNPVSEEQQENSLSNSLLRESLSLTRIWILGPAGIYAGEEDMKWRGDVNLING